MKIDKLPTRKQSARENIEHFSKLTVSRKIHLLEKNRRAAVYLRTLVPGGSPDR